MTSTPPASTPPTSTPQRLTRLTADRYLDLLHRDGERLLMVAEDALDREVPSCEGWTVRDVVEHVGMVYGHKIAALELGRRPEEGEWTGPPAADACVAWCHGLLHRLAADLAHRDPQAPAWTWWPEEQTVGFWQRRMALETVVHRVDVEQAVGDVTPVAGDLALDGIDEVLRIMLADADVTNIAGPTVGGTGTSVVLGSVTVTGSAGDVFLWLWGRGSDDAVRFAGEHVDIPRMRAILTAATQ